MTSYKEMLISYAPNGQIVINYTCILPTSSPVNGTREDISNVSCPRAHDCDVNQRLVATAGRPADAEAYTDYTDRSAR